MLRNDNLYELPQNLPVPVDDGATNHLLGLQLPSIEILSPNQSHTKVLGKLLHCSQHGTGLGWLLDPEEESILAVFPEQKVELYRGATRLPVINGIELELTVSDVFSWLSFA